MAQKKFDLTKCLGTISTVKVAAGHLINKINLTGDNRMQSTRLS